MNWNIDTMPRAGQAQPFTVAVAAFVDQLRGRGLENTAENRQQVYARLDEATGAALMREANRNGWGPDQLDDVLATLAGDTTADEGQPTGGGEVPIVWK